MPRKHAAYLAAGFTLLWAASVLPYLLSPLGEYPVVDASWHMEWAGGIARGNTLIYSPYFRAPLYPFLLGAVFSITGVSVIAGALTGFILGLASVILVYRIVEAGGGRGAALLAAALAAVNGVFLFYTSALLITSLYAFLLLLSFKLFQGDRPSPLAWAVLGLAAVARPSAVLIAPLALVIYPGVRKWCWLFLPPVLAVWAVNSAGGDPATVISSQGGVNFYIGSGPEADGYTSFAPRTTGPGTLDEDLPYVDNVWESSVRPLETGTPPSQISAWWTRRTLDHISGDPRGTISLFSRKLLYTLSPVAVPSNYDVYYCSRYSPVLRMLTGSPGFPVHGLLLWMLVPGALLAGALKVTERAAFLWAAAISAGVLPFFITARFLLPAVPFLVILLAPRFLRKPRRAFVAAPAGLAAGLALAFLTGHTVKNGGVNMAFHDGIAHYREGQTERSRALFLQAVDVALERDDGVDLNGTDALFNLGLISLREGDPEGAETWWTLALERDPSYLPAARALMELKH